MAKMKTATIGSAVAALVLAGSAMQAAAQETTLGALIADGFEVKAMTASDLDPNDADNTPNIFIIVQKDTELFGCALRSVVSSFCQRIE